MSDRPIAVGDLVQVVRSCCSRRVKPVVFQVAEILPCKAKRFFCSYCNSAMPLEPYGWAGTNDAAIQPISRLKRIPPLDELERVVLTADDDIIIEQRDPA